MRKIALMLVIVITSIITGSCSTAQTRYVTEPLSLPARPVLPSITAAELKPLPDAVVWQLIERDRLRREYAEKLETIIKATQVEN